MEIIISYSKFMTALQEHYGLFESELSENLTLQYVMDRWPEQDMQKVFNTLVVKLSNQYKIPPSPAVLEQIFPRPGADPAEAAEMAWNILLKAGNGSSVLITDPVAQEAVINLGGWETFCLRRMDDPKWTRKDFMDAYKNLIHSCAKSEPQILFGTFDAMNGTANWRWFKILGDQMKGREMLTQVLINMPQIAGQRGGGAHIAQIIDIVVKQLPEASPVQEFQK